MFGAFEGRSILRVVGTHPGTSQAPETVRSSSAERAPTYVLAGELFAVRGPAPRSPSVEIVDTLRAEGISVCRGRAPEVEASSELLPVYRLGGSGPVAVATGRVLVRFAEDVSAEERAADLARVGFAVVDLLAHAPNAAWVRAKDGGVAASLVGLKSLATLPGVEHVEPQMLARARRR